MRLETLVTLSYSSIFTLTLKNTLDHKIIKTFRNKKHSDEDRKLIEFKLIIHALKKSLKILLSYKQMLQKSITDQCSPQHVRHSDRPVKTDFCTPTSLER